MCGGGKKARNLTGRKTNQEEVVHHSTAITSQRGRQVGSGGPKGSNHEHAGAFKAMPNLGGGGTSSIHSSAPSLFSTDGSGSSFAGGRAGPDGGLNLMAANSNLSTPSSSLYSTNSSAGGGSTLANPGHGSGGGANSAIGSSLSSHISSFDSSNVSSLSKPKSSKETSTAIAAGPIGSKPPSKKQDFGGAAKPPSNPAANISMAGAKEGGGGGHNAKVVGDIVPIAGPKKPSSASSSKMKQPKQAHSVAN